MIERSFSVDGARPVVAMHRLLARLRHRDPLQEVTLGSPPFERNALNRITAVRLRFRPRLLV